MKSIYIKLTIIWMLFLVITSCNTEFKKLAISKTDAVKIDMATKFTTSYFETLKNGYSYDFRNIATKDFFDKMTPDFQKQSYKEIALQFGDLQSAIYSATWIGKGNPELEIIRFKGKFEKSATPLEIRVIVNEDNKISGFWIMPWIDNLNDY